MSPSARSLGIWSATLALVFSVTYDIGQVAEWLGWLGSKGGPESMSTPLGIAILLTPSLLLGPSFLLAMVCLHEFAAPARKVWTHAAVAFATVYLVMIAINYYVQLTWVMPRLAAGRTAGMEQFLFVPFDSFLYAVDILGYGFMSLASLFAAMALGSSGHQSAARWWLIATGVLLPFITLQMYWHSLIWFAAAWAFTFPAAMWALRCVFREARVEREVALAEGIGALAGAGRIK